jgi:beta-glucuronidase
MRIARWSPSGLTAGSAETSPPQAAASKSRRRLATTIALCAGLSLALPAFAHAQGPAYSAQPPTKGAQYRDGQSGRYQLGGEWLYRPDFADLGQSVGWWRNIAWTDGWSPVTMPNAYNANDLSTLSMDGWVGWYRKDFTLPAGAFSRYVPSKDRHWIIRFDSVNYQATVWLNGHELGTHAGANLPFEFDLRGLHRGVNRLIVRVDNRLSPTTLPKSQYGGWWNYGGILDGVYLRPAQRVDISQVQVRPILRCPTCSATIEDQAIIRNVTAAPQSVSLRGTYGGVRLNFGSRRIAPHASWTAQASATLRHPRLWSPGHPALYGATLTASDARGRRLGSYFLYSGVRKITVTSAGHLALNGRLLNLRGVDMHEQALGSGAALDLAQMRRLMGWVQELGATVIREHYPLNPEMQEMADRDGIMLWSEIPVWRTSAQYLNQPAWVAGAHAVLTENILTNQNHPSVLLWSIGNELKTPAPGSEASYIAGAVALAHKLDPTRPVGMAISDWPGVPCQNAYGPLNLIGFNDYFGWFDAGGGGTDDRDSLSPFLDSLRACYPTKALFISEFGFDGSRSGPVEERGTYAFQANAAAFHLGVFASKPWLSGAIYWLIQDFVAWPGWDGGDPRGTPPFVQKGLVSLQGNLKPAFGVVQSIYKSTVQIAPVVRHGR